MNVSDFLLQRLAAWGVKRVFGFPGDGINAILGAFNRNDHGIKFVQVRHEEMAAFMACGHAKFTGEVGVCLATSGPGAIHLLNGLYDAKMDHAPVVAIVGQSARSAMGGDYQQEVDLQNLFKDVAHEYVHTCMTAESARHLVDRAVRIAKAERTVTCLVFPKDVQEMDAAEPGHAHDTVHTSVGYVAPRVVPVESELDRAAQVLNAGEKVAMLVGAGAKDAATEVVAVAQALGAGVAKALLGKAVVPDDLPFVTGPIGLLGTKPSWDLMMECDTLLMVGSSFPYAEFLPKEGKARGVQIDVDGRMIGMRYPMEVNLVGDSKETLRALLPRLRRRPPEDAWRRKIVEANAAWEKLMDERAHAPADPMNPQRVFWELSPRLPDRCILTSDSGSAANWFARDLKLRKGMMASLSGSLATMGPGVPYAIAAKFAHPDRPVIALVGDGAMQMNGNAEMLTVAKYWEEWSDPRFVVLVLNNGDLNQVTWEMRAMEGDPRYEASQSLPDFPYARYADLIGLKGIRVDRPEDLGQAWESALSADRPVVLEAIVDPDVPPLPPHITLKQAKAFGMTLLRGDADEGGIIKQAVRQMFPGTSEKS
ncbi:MAG TPA: thiamine pyrophosphate-requiring protein [Polyangiaceae bacterium]|jgi:pyruvate dehydrogenase (quinone)|nr:thiamine pyrophosphate-requiring protein [Polyangiaceae bacterium]